jgi:hypothetical protein
MPSMKLNTNISGTPIIHQPPNPSGKIIFTKLSKIAPANPA